MTNSGSIIEKIETEMLDFIMSNTKILETRYEIYFDKEIINKK